MDPLTDRLLVVSGAVVSWHFELLPRWALAVLAARELFMLVARRAGAAARRRPEHQLARARWRLPVMGALVLRASCGLQVSRVLLYVGLAMALVGDRALRSGCACAQLATQTLNLSLRLDDRVALCSPARHSRGEDRMMDTFPDLGSLSDQELKDLIQQLTEEEQRDLLQAPHPARQDRHPARGARQPAAQEARGGRGRHHRRRRPAAHRHPRRHARPSPTRRRTAEARRRGAALPRVRLRQRRGRQLLPEVRRVPRRAPSRRRSRRHGRPTRSTRPAS